MKSPLPTLFVLRIILLIGLIGCTNKSVNKSNIASTLSNTSIQKVELTNIYTQAIGDYLRLVKGEYQLNFDTLLFGKHAYGQPDDFPDIELPSMIAGTNIRLVPQTEGEKIQKENKSSVFINLMGWADTTEAEFIFVTFSNGFAHQFDCFINYQYNPARKGYELLDSRFENFLYKKD